MTTLNMIERPSVDGVTCYGCGALHIPYARRREPRPGEVDTVAFAAVWDVIKHVDVHYPNGMKSGATGNDVCALLDMMSEYHVVKP